MSGDRQQLAPVGRSRGPRNRALEGVRRWLSEANLVPGQFLPSEHELAARMHISRSTLRLALQELENEGLFQTVHGKGRIITSACAGDSIVARTVWVLSHFSQTATLADYSTTGFSEFIQAGVLEALQAEGLHATVLHPGHITARHLGASRGDRPRGMILFPLALRWAKGCEILRALESARVPIVTFERSVSWGENFDAVMPDHETGCCELTRWLIAKGHRRIVRFWQWPREDGDVRPDWLQRRDTGYERAMREAGLEVLPAVEAHLEPLDSCTEEEFQRKVRDAAGLLPEHLSGPHPVDAIIAGSDSIAFAVAAACRLFHKVPNRDVAIAGYDNVWADCRERQWEPTIPVATVEKFNLRLGQELVRVLQARIKGELPPEPQTVKVRPQVVATIGH